VYLGGEKRVAKIKAPMTDIEITLNADLDFDAIRKGLTKNRRAHIPGIYPDEVVTALYDCLRHDVPWTVSFNSGDNNYDLEAAQIEAMPQLDRLKLSDGIAAQANKDFTYIFHNYRVDEAIERGENNALFLHRYYEFINSDEYKNFIRYITDIKEIDFIDAQATKYVHGHFLTKHDDLNQVKGRRLAMILNLTPDWNADWGGLLQFHDDDGHISEALSPMFNALNFLYVGEQHSVSYVTPFAGTPRYSITGWVREHD
jgi:SM-20-related protein